ncbi:MULTISPECIES: hypothetical protein [Bradyrhizobium]|nr:hypothetical protein [Bradyrhizobium elkanii]
MKIQTTLTWAALALVVDGSALAQNGQAPKRVTPKVDEAIPNAIDEDSG